MDKTKRQLAFSFILLAVLLYWSSMNEDSQANLPPVAANTTSENAIEVSFMDNLFVQISDLEDRWYKFELDGTNNNFSLILLSQSDPIDFEYISVTIYGPDSDEVEVGNIVKGETTFHGYIISGADAGMYYAKILANGISSSYQLYGALLPYTIDGGIDFGSAVDHGSSWDIEAHLDQPRYYAVELEAYQEIDINITYFDTSYVTMSFFDPNYELMTPIENNHEEFMYQQKNNSKFAAEETGTHYIVLEGLRLSSG